MAHYGFDQDNSDREAMADAAYDRFVERVDNGEQCPDCKAIGMIERRSAAGIPLWHCGVCGTEWFDFVTRPTREAA